MMCVLIDPAYIRAYDYKDTVKLFLVLKFNMYILIINNF